MPEPRRDIEQSTIEAWSEWITENSALFETKWEQVFAEYVLARVRGLRTDDVTPQLTVHIASGRQRRIDFAVQVDDVRLAVEVDGFDKTGSGGPSARQQRATSERDMELRQQGWTPFHVANTTLQYPASRENTILALESELRRAKAKPFEPREEEENATKKSRVLLAASVILATTLIIAIVWSASGNPCGQEAQPWTEAKVEDTGVYYGPIARIGADSETLTGFIDIGRAFPDPMRLTAVIFDRETTGNGWDFDALTVGQVVCVAGSVQEYGGSREVVVDSPSQFQLGQ